MPTEDLSYFHEDEFKEKLALYEQMVKGGQSVYLEADELTDIAEYYLIQNKKQKATDCIQYALSLHPGSIDPLIFLARQKMFDGDTEGAKTISDCITDQHDREVVFFNAELLLREGKEGEACAYLEKMAETDDEDPAMYAYDTAVLFLDYGYMEEAAQWGQKALDMEPENEKFLRFKADFLIASNRLQEAERLLDTLLDRNPYDLNAWNSLGEAYFVGGNYPKTLEAADFALAIDEHDAQAILLKANCLFQQQQYEAAHKTYTRYFEEYKANEIPYLFDGASLMAMGAHAEALGQLLNAEEIAQASGQFQVVGRINKPFLEVPRAVAVDFAEGVLFPVLARCAYINRVGRGVLHVDAVAEVASLETHRTSVALVVVGTVASVQVQCPRFRRFFADDVDDTAHCVRAVKRGCCAFHDFHPLHIVQIQAGIVDVVQRLSGKTLAVH